MIDQRSKIQKIRGSVSLVIVIVIGALAYKLYVHHSQRQTQPQASSLNTEALSEFILPLSELSSMSLRAASEPSSQGYIMTVVSDSNSSVIKAQLDTNGNLLGTETFDLTSLLDPLLTSNQKLLANDRFDFEGIAQDPLGQYALVSEAYRQILMLDAALRNLLGVIELDGPYGLPSLANDGPEGVLLLRDGHLLIVKEKNPAVIIEYGPEGHTAKGFSQDRLIPDQRGFQFTSPFARLKPLATWKMEIRDHNFSDCDFSDVSLDWSQNLIILSDECQTVFLIEPLAPIDEFFHIKESWSLPAKTKNPEAIAALANKRLFVGQDRGKINKPNVRIVQIPL